MKIQPQNPKSRPKTESLFETVDLFDYLFVFQQNVSEGEGIRGFENVQYRAREEVKGFIVRQYNFTIKSCLSSLFCHLKRLQYLKIP